MRNQLKKVILMLSGNALFSLTPVIAFLLICLSYSEFTSFLCRAYWLFYMLDLAEKTFPKAYLSSSRKRIHLMDALAVPYHKKSYFTVQILVLSGLCMFVMLMITASSLIGKSSLYPNAAAAMLDTLCYSILYLIPLLLSQFSTDELSSRLLLIIAIIFGIGYVFPLFFPLYSLMSLLLILAAFLLFWLSKSNWWHQDNSSSSQKTVITKNQKGILILSKMSVVKQDEFLEAVRGGSFGYTFYYLLRTISRVIKGSLPLEELFTWSGVMWILIFLSLLSSIYALRRIYITKSMLRVVPIPRKALFSACTSLALRPVILVEIILLTAAYLLHSGNDFSAFFHSSHPVEIIVHGLILVTLPIAIYLMSFTVYASKDRGMIGFVLFIMAVIGGYSLLIAGALVQDGLPSKIVFLLLISTVPYFTAFRGLKNLDNIHS